MNLKRLDRRFFLVALAAGSLAGCGFEPVYGDRTVRERTPGGPATAQIRDDMAGIWVEPIPDRIGQILRNQLIDLLNGTNEPTQPLYRLEVTLKQLKQAVLERRETLETATNLIIIANYKLKAPNGDLLTANQSRSIVLYNQLSSPYATVAAEDYARDRALRPLAEDMRLRLSLYLANRKGT
jgi:LPS-assembly lipoprotein